MAGYYKRVEVGVAEEGPIPDQDKWCYRMVTIPALTPPDQMEQTVLERYLEKFGDSIIHKFWIQNIGDAEKIEDEDIPTSESIEVM